MIKMWEEFSYKGIDIEEIKDVFQYLIDDWDLFDTTEDEQGLIRDESGKLLTKIEYTYFIYEHDIRKGIGPYIYLPERDLVPAHFWQKSISQIRHPHLEDILEYNGIKAIKYINSAREMPGGRSNDFGIYINLAGPNDFYTIRSKFLDDLDIIKKRIDNMGYNCKLLTHYVYTSQFILFITNK